MDDLDFSGKPAAPAQANGQNVGPSQVPATHQAPLPAAAAGNDSFLGRIGRKLRSLVGG